MWALSGAFWVHFCPFVQCRYRCQVHQEHVLGSCDFSHDQQPSCVGSTHLAIYLKLLLYHATDPILEFPRQERVVVDNEVEGIED